jgi:hypothetical protein
MKETVTIMAIQTTHPVDRTLREADIASRLSAVDSGTGWGPFISNAQGDMLFLLRTIHTLRQENAALKQQVTQHERSTVRVPVIVVDGTGPIQFPDSASE